MYCDGGKNAFATNKIPSHNNYLSDLRRREGDLTEAYDLCERAKEIAEKEIATGPWVSVSIYKMGHIRLLQNRLDEARQVSILSGYP